MSYKKPPSSGTFRIALKKVATMTRPIQKINGKVYSALSLPLEDEKGNTENAIVVFDETFTELYCDIALEGHKPINEAPFKFEVVNLDQADCVLSAAAYQNIVLEKNHLDKPSVSFKYIKENIDRFVGFDGSFASQDQMSAMLACWTMATYITPILDTVGYFWPNGEKGSGKSQCLKTVLQMSFLGRTLTAGSTYASVRDQADLGAALGFDDCEKIKDMDSSKRELLLAGNTKGVTATVQVPGGRDGEWKTRKVDAFAPRAFTSIGLPDATLGSRTIMVPLARTDDVEKTRRKPTNVKDWLVDPAYVRDVTWLNIVKELNQIEVAKEWVNTSTSVAGRDFDIFQGILAIAQWLEKDHGEEGLLTSMLDVMEKYLAQRDANVLPSLEELFLEAMAEKFSPILGNSVTMATNEIANSITRLCDAKDITDEDLANAGNQRIGQLLSRLGFEKSSSHGARRSWNIDRTLVERHCKAHGIIITPVMETPIPAFEYAAPAVDGKTEVSDELPW